MERVAKFLKEASTYYLATMEGDQPRVRPFGTAHIFEDKLYIQTGKVKDVSKQIRENEISMLTSSISAHPKLRERLVALQQQMARDKGFIMDGRDIGTVVLPDAELKIYMVASVKARADRRYKEYLGKHVEADYDEIYRDIEQRDYQDMNRKTSPLRKAEDAIEIDTSNMTITEVVEEIRRNIPTLS